MTTKFLLIALSSAGGLLVGLFFANTLKAKRDFYCELSSFIDAVMSDLTFRQDGVQAVAKNLSLNCKSKLSSVLAFYEQQPQQSLNLTFLPKNERQLVEGFFSGLGKSDILTEKSELNVAKAKIEELNAFYKAKSATQAPMFIKLGLLGGLALGILML